MQDVRSEVASTPSRNKAKWNVIRAYQKYHNFYERIIIQKWAKMR